MDLGFESLRDRQSNMSKAIFRKFKKSDIEAVIKLWKKCKLIVPWNDPYKDINYRLYEIQESQIYGKRLIEDN